MAVRPSLVAGTAVAAAAVAVIAAAPALAQATSAQPADRVTVAGSAPSWAVPQAKVGGVSAGAQRQVQVALSLRDEAGAQALAKAVSTPGSREFGRHLSSQQFVDRFAATQSTVDDVTTWLRGQGAQVQGVSTNRHFIDVTASTGQLESMFGVRLSTYRHKAADGRVRDLVAPESAISVPATLRPAVATVLGLDDSEKTVSTQRVHASTPKGAVPAASTAGQSCAPYWDAQNNTSVPQKYGAGDQSNALCGYNDAQIRSMYGLGTGNTGTGQKIGIVGAYNLTSIVADTNRAASHFGAPALAAGQYDAVLPQGGIVNDPGCEGPDSWAGEQALDVQSVHTVAPAAHITYYAGKNCFGLYDALNQAVQDNTVSVISNSWLYPGEQAVSAATRDQLNSIAVQAAIQGQSLLFCSGDSGDNSAVGGAPAATFPASSPWVTAVGGTTVALNADATTKFTTGWESSGNTLTGGAWTPLQAKNGQFAGGAGGGVSALYDAPDYQVGKVPAAIAKGHRAIPDISALADAYTGMAVGFTSASGYVEYATGGTSLASPLVAALTADALQVHKTDRMGFLNPALYDMAGTSAIADVTPHAAGIYTPGMASFGYVPVPNGPGNYLIDTDTKPQTLQSAPGWDPVTGLGTPTGSYLTSLGS